MFNWSALPTELKFMIVAHYIDDLVTPTAQYIQMRDSLFTRPHKDWIMGAFKIDLDNLLKREVVERQVRVLEDALPEMRFYVSELFDNMFATLLSEPRVGVCPPEIGPNFVDWYIGVHEWKYRQLMVSQLSKMRVGEETSS